MANQGGIKDVAEGRSDIYKLRPSDLHIRDGWNARNIDFDPADAEDLALAKSISEVGVKEPLTVVWQESRAYVTNGHRRRAAALYAIAALGAELKTIPCQTEERYSSEADHVLSMIIRNSGKPLTPLEQARVFKRLIDLGWSETEIARRVGKSRQWICDLLGLQAAPAEITGMVKAGEVSATLAIQTMATEKGRAAEVLTSAITTAKAAGKDKATAKHVRQGVVKVDPIVAFDNAVAEFERAAKDAGLYMPGLATRLRLHADTLAERYPDDANGGDA